jgi:RNA polymerase sigma-70 factor, ECF subfamily
MSDVALAARAMQGDDASFGELADRYRPAVFATALRVSGDRTEAADIAQEALVQAFLGIRSLEAPRAFAPWLRTLAERTAQRHSSGWRRRRATEEPLDADLWPAPDETGPATHALRRETSDVVWRAVSTLEPEDAEIVAMRYLSDLTLETIAGYLGLTRDGAKYRLKRATIRLRSALRDYVEGRVSDGEPRVERAHAERGHAACGY